MRSVGAALAARTGLAVRYVDERFTTASALRTIKTIRADQLAAERATSMRSLLPSCCSMRWRSPSRPLNAGPARAARAVLVRIAVVCVVCAACAGEPHGVPQRVVIAPGTSLRAAADSLARAGVIHMPWLFRLYASAKHHDRDVKAGTYLLQRDLPWPRRSTR